VSAMTKPNRASLLASLKSAQSRLGYLSPQAMAEIAEGHGVSESHVYGVASFYSLLYCKPAAKHIIRLCGSLSCHFAGSNGPAESARKVLGIRPGEVTSDGLFAVESVGCLGACGAGPAALIDDRLYTRVDAEKLARLVSAVRDGEPEPADGAFGPDAARAIGGPVLTSKSVERLLCCPKPEGILSAIEASGLRGRGGAAFPTGRKWRICAESPGDAKYVVCNADEGEPGMFKDRYLLVHRPDLMLAGMKLAMRAVGAQKGYVYLRGEYHDAREELEREMGRTPDTSNIGIVSGAGAYVCGEETALLESIEGERGVSRLRPPYPPVSGLFGCPTVINNVETLSLAPLIISRGSEWFRGLGTEESRGVKLFSVSGDVKRPGLIEAPLGMTLSEILDEAEASDVKAALVGGASGTLVPTSEFGRKLCYEDLNPGAGAIIAIGEDRSMRDVVTNLMEFFEHESCGECAPCRIGTARAREILAGARQAGGAAETLRSIGETLVNASRCGLGQTASSALLDALRLFPDEFEWEAGA